MSFINFWEENNKWQVVIRAETSEEMFMIPWECDSREEAIAYIEGMKFGSSKLDNLKIKEGIKYKDLEE